MGHELESRKSRPGAMYVTFSLCSSSPSPSDVSSIHQNVPQNTPTYNSNLLHSFESFRLSSTTRQMKFVLFSAILPSLVTALQSPYLSQLNGGASVSFAPNGATVTAPPPPTSGTPSQELLDLWSNQVSVELSASQLYLSASIWFRARDMDGMAAWMLGESGEERGHGLEILEFAMKKNFPVQLKPLDAPRSDWETPVQVWEDILKAEQTNTQNLLKLAAIADQCGDLMIEETRFFESYVSYIVKVFG